MGSAAEHAAVPLPNRRVCSPGRVASEPTLVVLLLALALPAPDGARAQSRLGAPGASASGWVIDGADLLTPEQEAALDSRLAEHERATTNQVVVETVLSLDGAPLEEFSLAEATRLAIGQRGRDNGVLFLVAFHDRALRIEVGYGLEEHLTDALSGRILRERVKPRFREGDYAGGIDAGVTAILGALDGTLPAGALDRLPLVGVGLERLRGWYGGLPDAPAGDQAFLGLFLFLFGPILSLLVFAWVPWKKLAAGLGLGLFGGVALTLVSRYPFLLVAPAGIALLVLVAWLDRRFWGGRLAKAFRALQAAGGGSGGGSRSGGGSSSWSSGSSSRSSSSSFSGGGGSFGGGGASSRW
jgi:uncharacterized protein